MATKSTPVSILREKHEKELLELLGKLSTETTDVLKKLVHSFEKLPDEAQVTFFKSEDGKAALKLFGLTHKTAGGGSGGGGKGGERVDGETLVKTILGIVKAAGDEGISQADIVKHKDMVELYKTVGKEVSPQANKLATLVEEKKLKDNGKEGKARKFIIK